MISKYQNMRMCNNWSVTIYTYRVRNKNLSNSNLVQYILDISRYVFFKELRKELHSWGVFREFIVFDIALWSNAINQESTVLGIRFNGLLLHSTKVFLNWTSTKITEQISICV